MNRRLVIAVLRAISRRRRIVLAAPVGAGRGTAEDAGDHSPGLLLHTEAMQSESSHPERPRAPADGDERSKDDASPQGADERPGGGPIEYVGPARPIDPARRRAKPGDEQGADSSGSDAARPAGPAPADPDRRAAEAREAPPTPAAEPPRRPPTRHGRRRPPSVIGAVDRVRRADFPVVLRGYDRSAVDAYVAEVAQLVAELEATQLPEAAVQRALDEVGDETSEILKRAHEAAEEVTSRSRSEAAALLAGAERDAELIRKDADDQIRTLDDDLRAIWQERQRLIDDLRQLAEDVLALSDDALDRAPPPGVATEEAEEAPILPDEEERQADLPDDQPATVEQAPDEPGASERPPGQAGP